MVQQTQRFRHIDFPSVLYECLRAYYSVNTQGQVSWLYKYCAAIVQPLQQSWLTYESQRAINGLIAQSKFQIGQLTNVLNYLYDPTLNRIYITQGSFNQIVMRTFTDSPIAFERTFSDAPILFLRPFGEPSKFIAAVIHVPISANVSALTATVAQIAIEGTFYQIQTF